MITKSRRGLLRATLMASLAMLVGPIPNSAVAADRATLHAPAESFPIVAWYGPPEEQTTLERYRELADAGFTHNLSFLASADAAFKALDTARAAGVKLILMCPELLGAEPEPAVRRFMDHPALAAYYVRDEPPAKEFADLTARLKRIQAIDARHPCYINLFPNYATTGEGGQLGTATYGEYVERFAREIPVSIFSFDYYPIVVEEPGAPDRLPPSLRPGWYDNLEQVAAAARSQKKPLWAFALSVPHDRYPAPTAAHLRLQVFSNLAYGAQAIQYFTYWTPVMKEFDFHDAPLTSNGVRTPVYDLVKELNREIQGLRGVFLGARVLSVGHTGEMLPEGTRPFEPAAPVRRLKTGERGAVVSHLVSGARRFLVVVNHNIDGPMPLAIELDPSAVAHRVGKDGSLEAVAGSRFETKIDPGDVCVLTWPGAAPDEKEPDNARPPRDEADLRYWLENMVWHHRFSKGEVHEATGLSEDKIAAALKKFDIRPETKPKPRAEAPLLVLPYPGGRHPRIGFLDGAVRPQRETKVSVFTPWDEASYVVADVPEALWSNLGLTYLAHTHVPTIWTKQNIELEKREWTSYRNGSFDLERKLPNGIVLGARIDPGRDAVRMELWLTNGTKEPLSDLRVQNCVMLKGATGFEEQTNDNKTFRKPYVAVRNKAGNRWIITAWEPCDRPWANPPCPCLHSDPKFPDCAPGKTERLRGWLSFYEGTEIKKEFDRIDATGWSKVQP